MNELRSKAIGCLSGAAVGDALGSATEGYSHEQILKRYGGPVTGIVAPYVDAGRGPTRYQKGDGRITDDTLMTLALVEVYRQLRRHLDAYDIAQTLVPLLMNTVRWLPDMEREDTLLQRLFLAEKWLVTKLHYAHTDPREAGVGNMVNCGAAMYMAPVGIANAGDPGGAYAEAIDIAGAHQSSYGREAAGVFAAAVAAAMAPGGTAQDVAAVAIDLAHDGTRAALEAVRATAARIDDWRSAAPRLREAIAPYDSVGPDFRDPGLGARRPSRLHSIEELPVAIGFVLIAGGEYESAVLGAVNYGRDADSIGTMAGAISGALGGRETVPAQWRDFVARESRIDLEEPGLAMADIAEEIFALDDRRHTSRSDALRRVREGLHAGHVGPA
ncbi:MAG TPA: ADP-ribosylglycohydrolase family protein [Candidatus Limnocylindria bacterium]|nr:ADP-ribosylglycohydrolase family protein [Candidatus Limnocylindria bacterium]